MNEQKLVELLKDMSLEEKIGQLLQVSGYYFEEEGVVTGPANQAGFTQEEIDMAGSVLGVCGADKIIEIQKKFMEKQPHHIPLIFMADVINGFRTVFPIPLAQGCSFEPKLTQEAAEISAKESTISGLHLTFSPMADLVRDPRWGRVMESTGEDVFLNGEFAKAMVKGYQGESDKNLADPYKIAACIKHFAGYGAPMAGREYNTVEVSNRTLFEQFLPAYQKAIEAGCASAMTSFNTLDRVPSTANKWLLRDVLRTQMGFMGVVISDWAAIEELICHGVADSKKQAANLALTAGVDIDMMTTCFCRNVKDLIEEGSLDQAYLDEAVYRILRLKNNLGLFENPFKDASDGEEKKFLLSKEHRKSARDIAASTMVLLKNENQMLPLEKEKMKLVFIGPHATTPYLMGVWSMFGRYEDVVSIEEGVKAKQKGNVTFLKGAPFASNIEKLELNPQVRAEMQADIENKDLLQKEAVEAAKAADLVVMTLGEHPCESGEATSKTNIELDQAQLQLLSAVHQVNDNIVTVLMNGRPMIIEEVLAHSKAVLEAWLPGTEGGNAIADVLFGDVNPSGKLTMSFPKNVGQIPVYYNDFPTGRPQNFKKEKYLSQYIDCENEPLFPFGYGQSYSKFMISDIDLNQNVIGKEDILKASVWVENTSSVDGKATVQLYVRDEFASVSRPKKELKGFQKIALKAGEKTKVEFELTIKELRFYDIDMNYVCELGDFQLFIGEDSDTNNSVRFTYKESK